MEPKEPILTDEEQAAEDWWEYEKGQKRDSTRYVDQIPDADFYGG